MFVFAVVIVANLLTLTNSESFISKEGETGIPTDSIVLNKKFFQESKEETNKEEHIRSKRQIRPNLHNGIPGFHSFPHALHQTMSFTPPEIFQRQHVLTPSIQQSSTSIHRHLTRQPPLNFLNSNLQHIVTVPSALSDVDQTVAPSDLNRQVISPQSLVTNNEDVSSSKTSTERTISLDNLKNMIRGTLKLLKDNDITVTISNSNKESSSPRENNIGGQVLTVDSLRRQRGIEDAEIVRTSPRHPSAIINIIPSDPRRQVTATRVPVVPMPVVHPGVTNIPQTQLVMTQPIHPQMPMTQPLSFVQPFVTGLLTNQGLLPTALSHLRPPPVPEQPSSMERTLPWLMLGALALG